MKIQNSSKGLAGAGILTAIAASLCCITPVLALFAGVSGMASAFSWLEPARPYLVGITVLVISFAWVQKLKPKKTEEDCACNENEKPSFLQSKMFLGIVTIFVGLMLAFPNYSYIFYPETNTKIIVIESGNVQIVNLTIEGMTCTSCQEHIKNAVSKLPGFMEASVDYNIGKAEVKFDKSKVSLEQVVAAVNETGYKVTDYKLID